MLKLPILLTEIDAKVFETHDKCRVWCHGDFGRGIQVKASPRHHLAELTLSCYITLPDLSEESGIVHDGLLHLLTVAKGSSTPHGPFFRDPTQLRDQHGGIYLTITYDARRAVFEVRKNVGGGASELVGVILEGARPELICGRVLELYVEINQDQICVWLHNRFSGGDFVLQASSRWPQPDAGCEDQEHCQPWGASPAGTWWVLSGMSNDPDTPASDLPVGFALSNLRVVLAAEDEEAVGSLLYRGALDHLVGGPPLDVARREALALTGHRKALRLIATDLERIRLLLPVLGSSDGAMALEVAAASIGKAAADKALISTQSNLAQ